MVPVVFFSKVGCPYCDKLEQDLINMEIPFEKIIPLTEEIPELKVMTKMTTFPMVYIGKECIGGYSDFSNLIATNNLQNKIQENTGVAINIPLDF